MADTLSAVLSLLVSILVSGLVWITVGVGLVQLVRERLQGIVVLIHDPARKHYPRRSDPAPQIPQQQPMPGG